MAKGNPIVLVRLTPEILAQIHGAIEGRNRRTREEPWDRSGFIRIAIREKLHHMRRSRRSRGRRPATANGAKPTEDTTDAN